MKESSEVKLRTLRIGFVGAAAGARRTCVPDFRGRECQTRAGACEWDMHHTYSWSCEILKH